MTERITARKNPLIQQVRRLLSSRREREEAGLFVADGTKLLAEAVKWWPGLETVILSDGVEANVPVGVRLVRVPEDVMESVSPMRSPQGALFICRLPEKESFAPSAGMLLLDGIQDPGNIGTILRTCEAMAVKGVFLCGCADCFSPKVLRGTMGCIFRLPIKVFSETAEALGLLKEAGVSTYASALAENALLLPKVKFSEKSCVLIGNEGNGLEHEVIEACDNVVMIPMPGKAESLNAASAAAIMIYSAAMQR